MSRLIDMSGKTFGRFTILRRATEGEASCGRYGADKVAWWIVKCTCGTIKAVPGKRIRSGNVTSCGCRSGRTREPGESAKWACFSWNKMSAKRRSIPFLLSLEQFLALTGAPCTYCGVLWSTQYPDYKKKNGTDKYFGAYRRNGIDRIDSRVGYIPSKCAPCCKNCNFAKAEMTVDEFRTWIDRVHEHIARPILEDNI